MITILGAGFGIYTLWKHKDLKLLVVYFALSGIIYPFETATLVYLQKYSYHIGVFQDVYKDSVLGNFISNLFIIPSTAIYLIANRKRIYWYILFAIFFIGIEQLFVYLSLFHHHNWKSVYTGAFLLFYFWLCSVIWERFKMNLGRLLVFVILSFACISIHGFITFLFLGGPGYFSFNPGLYIEPFRDHLAFSGPFLFLIGIIISVFVTFTYKRRYLYSLVVLILIDGILMFSGILTFPSSVACIAFFAVHMFSLAVTSVFYRWIN